MKTGRQYVYISIAVLILAGFLTGMYFLFPVEEKSEYFYVIFITIVISGANGQFFKWAWNKIIKRRAEKNPLLSSEKDQEN